MPQRIVASNQDQLSRQLAILIRDWDWNTPIEITYRRFRRKRTTSQQAKIHAMIRDLARHNDMEGEIGELKMKTIIKFNCPKWPGEEQVVNGQIEYVPKSEKELTVEEESEVIFYLQATGDEFGVEWTG